MIGHSSTSNSHGKVGRKRANTAPVPVLAWDSLLLFRNWTQSDSSLPGTVSRLCMRSPVPPAFGSANNRTCGTRYGTTLLSQMVSKGLDSRYCRMIPQSAILPRKAPGDRLCFVSFVLEIVSSESSRSEQAFLILAI